MLAYDLLFSYLLPWEPLDVVVVTNDRPYQLGSSDLNKYGLGGSQRWKQGPTMAVSGHLWLFPMIGEVHRSLQYLCSLQTVCIAAVASASEPGYHSGKYARGRARSAANSGLQVA